MHGRFLSVALAFLMVFSSFTAEAAKRMGSSNPTMSLRHKALSLHRMPHPPLLLLRRALHRKDVPGERCWADLQLVLV